MIHIREVIDLLSGEFFNLDEPGVFGPIVDTLMNGDFYLVLADFEGYRKAHLEADAIYSDRRRWGQITLMNIAKVGTFSSDRTISDYVRDIWKVERFPVLVNQ